MLTEETKEEIKEGFRRIRENNLLIFGILIGIIGGLIAGVINDLIRNSIFYPLAYLLILITVLLILVLNLLRPYIEFKICSHEIDKWMKQYKKMLSITKQHYAKYPKTS